MEFEFPQDIWMLIMGHFHSSYKRPGHYNAMLAVDDFYFTRMHHRENYKFSMMWNRSLMVDTYYMRLVVSQQRNVTSRLRSPRLNRGVATGSVAREFTAIYDTYKRNCVGNYLNSLAYKQSAV
jgi:hypothetical protein